MIDVTDRRNAEEESRASETRFRTLVDGSLFPVEVRLRPFHRGEHSACLLLARDIGERKHVEAEKAKLEGRLRQAEKMEAIGRFASGRESND